MKKFHLLITILSLFLLRGIELKAQLATVDVAAGITLGKQLAQTAKELGFAFEQVEALNKVYDQGQKLYNDAMVVKAGFEKHYKVVESARTLYRMSKMMENDMRAIHNNKNINNRERILILNRYKSLVKEATTVSKDFKELVGKDALKMSDGERLGLMNRTLDKLENIEELMIRDSYSLSKLIEERESMKRNYEKLRSYRRMKKY